VSPEQTVHQVESLADLRRAVGAGAARNLRLTASVLGATASVLEGAASVLDERFFKSDEGLQAVSHRTAASARRAEDRGLASRGRGPDSAFGSSAGGTLRAVPGPPQRTSPGGEAAPIGRLRGV
jgi:hypothetical protein